jgi:uncharacterized protein
MVEAGYDKSLLAPPLVQEENRLITPEEFILKANSRCNLACDYCYVYTMADQSWESQPIHMEQETVAAAGARLAEYATQQELSQIGVVFHGGEPLLEKPDWFNAAAETLHNAIPSKTVLNLGIQTNGILLTDKHLDVFRRWGISVGISLDGDREANDRHRRYRNGNSSYDDVLGAIDRIRTYDERLFAGLLCVIDLQNDPQRTYEALRIHEPPKLDFLLPHGNWETPPLGLDTQEKRARAPYAKWLTPIFDEWMAHDMRKTDVRLFNASLDRWAGKPNDFEALGGNALAELIIETDGSIENLDIIKSAFAGAPDLEHNVFDHSITEAVEAARSKLTSLGAAALASTCQNCPIGKVCGGGFYVHGYDEERKFANPSVFHEDLLRFLYHVKNQAREEVDVRKARAHIGEFPIMSRTHIV